MRMVPILSSRKRHRSSVSGPAWRWPCDGVNVKEKVREMERSVVLQTPKKKSDEVAKEKEGSDTWVLDVPPASLSIFTRLYPPFTHRLGQGRNSFNCLFSIFIFYSFFIYVLFLSLPRIMKKRGGVGLSGSSEGAPPLFSEVGQGRFWNTLSRHMWLWFEIQGSSFLPFFG